ncbi:MAG TPA: cytochrome c biogenesis protein ResB, partial [Verrucomicrobiae bacterium]|nr:cytochrome c biogenesis protein ResB [Verrucomicrobiae bacterium]
MSATNRGFAQKLWDFFCSLKLSIFLLIGLAATSVIGTIIPQNSPKEELQRRFSESTIRLFENLGFFDMYHSWWFILLLYLLTVNLVACSIKRLPRVWKIISEPVLKLDAGLEKSLSTVHEFKVSGTAEEMKGKMIAFLRGNFAPPVVTEADGECHLFAQKSPYSRLGVYVVHFSIVIIFIGAIVGSFAGYKAFVNIVEGTGTSTVYTRSEKQIDLGFTVKCEKFTVSFYDTGAPKEFRSLLTVIDNNKVVIDKRPIVVNDPLTYKGVTFYQSSYGPAGDAMFHLTVRSRNGGSPVRINARQGEGVKLPDGSTLQVMESTPDIRRFIPQLSGPAARLSVMSPKGG